MNAMLTRYNELVPKQVEQLFAAAQSAHLASVLPPSESTHSLHPAK